MRWLGLALVALGTWIAGARARGSVPSGPQAPAPDPTDPIIPTPVPQDPAAPLWWERQAPPAILAQLYGAEVEYGLPRGLLSRVAYQESRYNPAARSPAGAIGIMQFLPETAAEWGVDLSDEETVDDIRGAARFLVWLRGQTDSWAEALAGYNWGIGNLRRKGLENAPNETRRYIADIGRDVGLG